MPLEFLDVEVLPYIVWECAQFAYRPVTDEDCVFFHVSGHHLDLKIVMLYLGGEVGCPPDDCCCLDSEDDE